MQCPHCGFQHVEYKPRCARCKKPIAPPEDEISGGEKSEISAERSQAQESRPDIWSFKQGLESLTTSPKHFPHKYQSAQDTSMQAPEEEEDFSEIEINPVDTDAGTEDTAPIPPFEDHTPSQPPVRRPATTSPAKHVKEEEKAGEAALMIRRAAGASFDLMVWAAMGALLFKGAQLLAGRPVLSGSVLEWTWMVALPLSIMLFMLALVYGGLFGAVAGRTPGMMLAGLKLVNGQDSRPSLWQSLSCTALFILSVVPLGMGLVLGMRGRPRTWMHCRIPGVKVERA